MKTKLFILAALSSAAMLSADQWNQWSQDISANTQGQKTTSQHNPKAIMDDEIAKNVHDVLGGNWLTRGYPNVSFDVKNGTVNLRGVVDNLEERNKIEQSIKKIEGVKAVRSEITVGLQPSQQTKPRMLSMNNKNNNKISMNTANNFSSDNANTSAATFAKDSAATDQDRIINTKIRERISQWNPRGFETLVITTRNGAVVITGKIDRIEDIQRITNEARNVEGVKSVANQTTSKKF